MVRGNPGLAYRLGPDRKLQKRALGTGVILVAAVVLPAMLFAVLSLHDRSHLRD